RGGRRAAAGRRSSTGGAPTDSSGLTGSRCGKLSLDVGPGKLVGRAQAGARPFVPTGRPHVRPGRGGAGSAPRTGGGRRAPEDPDRRRRALRRARASDRSARGEKRAGGAARV